MPRLDRTDFALQACAPRIAKRGVAQHLVRETSAGFGSADRGKETERFHRLENVLNVAAAAIVASQTDADAGLADVEYGRDAALQFHVAEMIENDTGIGFRQPVHFLPIDPDAVDDVEPGVQQPIALE